jgi:phytol kinase
LSSINGDILGLLAVYLYIGVMVIVASKWSFLRRHGIHRKFIHIMIGNIVFIWWVFESNWVMALLAAAPFVPVLIFFSKEGEKIKEPHNKVEEEIKHSILAEASMEGHKLGLVYYAISWSILAFFLFNNLLAASVGIVAMAYGDGMGGIIGKKFGKHRIHGKKTLEGTLAVFAFSCLATMVVFAFYGMLAFNGLYPAKYIAAPLAVMIAAGVGVYVAIVELITPGEYDNLVIPLSTALILAAAGI